MATPPTFNVGAVLTAAQMNAVGLWLVKTQTIGSAVSSVIVTGAFNADFDNYKIVITGGTQTAGNGLLTAQLRTGSTTSTTGYYNTLLYSPYTGGVLTANQNNGAYWGYFAHALGTNGWSSTIDIMRPYAAVPTSFFGGGARGDLAGLNGGYHSASTSYDQLVLAVGSGTMTGGTIRIYGYRD